MYMYMHYAGLSTKDETLKTTERHLFLLIFLVCESVNSYIFISLQYAEP